MPVVGRTIEKALLDRLLASSEAELLAIYGRRRVGKTFLIREHYRKHLAFELTGLRNGPLPDQLANFHDELVRRGGKKALTPPLSWREAFQQLAGHLGAGRGTAKRVIFLDELPWLAGPRSGFLPALDHFWNTFLSRDPRFILVICGSAASWMISRIIDHKGGLHNRVTARMRLEPFSLAENAQFLKSRGIQLNSYDQLTLAMVMGGIPHYLKEVVPGKSAAQIADALCFRPQGLLHDEFDRLYASLFDSSDRHVEIVKRLAASPQGLTRSAFTGVYPTGGRLTTTLRELEEAGFISTHIPFAKKSKDTLHRLSDEYSLFYLKWISNRRLTGAGTFLKTQSSPGWRAWSGYALESLAHKHLARIKAALGIAEVETTHCSWVHHPDATWPDGAQIDLLIDRADNAINLVEIKFAREPFTITKAYAAELRRKIGVFRSVTGTRKNLFLTFLTPHGITPNAWSRELVHASILTDTLFQDSD